MKKSDELRNEIDKLSAKIEDLQNKEEFVEAAKWSGELNALVNQYKAAKALEEMEIKDMGKGAPAPASILYSGSSCALAMTTEKRRTANRVILPPIFLAIPSEATAPALFLVGVMMMHDIRKVNFTDYANAIPCFVCISVMPLTYSISDGILLSLITYVAIRILAGRWKELNIGMCILAILFVLKYAFL